MLFSRVDSKFVSAHIESIGLSINVLAKTTLRMILKLFLKFAACVEKGARVKQIIKKLAIDEVKIKIK